MRTIRRNLLMIAWGDDYPRRLRIAVGLTMLVLVVLMERTVSMDFVGLQERLMTWALEGVITARGIILLLAGVHDWHWTNRE